MEKKTKANLGLGAVLLAVCLFAIIPANGGARAAKAPKKTKMVYVCACLKTKSCSCMTEAKTEGPCSCGTEGGPPMTPVPANSSWAKYNRDQLAK